MASPLTQRTLAPTPSPPLATTQPAPATMTRGNATVDLNKIPPEGSIGRVLLTTLQNKQNSHVTALKELLRDRKARLLLPLSAFPHTPAHLKSDEYATKSQLEDHMVLLFKKTPEDTEQIFVTLSCLAGRIVRESLTVYGRVPNKDYEAIRDWQGLYDTAKTYTDAIPNRTEGDDGTSGLEPYSTVLFTDVEVPIGGCTALCVIITEPVTDPNDDVAAGRTGDGTESFDVAIPANVTKDVNSVIAKLKKHKKNGHSLDYLSADLQDFYVRLADRLAQGNDSSSQNSAPHIVDHAKVERQQEHIEQYICDGSYDILFAAPGSDDWVNDEQLESRIAALNILDISLEHLGVSEIEGLGDDAMVALVRQVGADLEKLVTCRSPSEKLAIIVNCHKMIVTALDVAQSAATLEIPSETAPAPVVPSSTNEEASSQAQDGDSAKPSSPKTPLIPETVRGQNDSEEQIEQPKRPRVSSADVLLPLLIYVVVKSNPPRLVSNLRFIQRYRNRALIRGEASYCLTNICAVVSFLENVELAGLGLSRPEIVLLNEIDVLKKANPVSGLPVGNDNPGVLLANRVGKEIAGVAEGVAGAGSKVFTGVVDMSSKVLGRLTFWGGNVSPNPSARPDDSRPDSPQNRLRRRLSLASKPKNSGPRSSEGGPKSTDREMKSMSIPPATTTTRTTTTMTTNPRDTEILDEKEIRTSPFDPSYLDGYTSDSANSQYHHSRPFDTVASVLNDVPPAIERFLECDVDDIRMGEIPDLLRDYRRLGNLVENLRRGTFRTGRWDDRNGG